MIVRYVNPEGLHKPIGCYSHAARRGNMVAVSGMASLDEVGEIVGTGDMAAQTAQTIRNLQAALAGVGARLDDIIKVTVYLADFAGYAEMDAAYRGFFGDVPPARATVRADLVYPALLIEMDAWAVVDEAAA